MKESEKLSMKEIDYVLEIEKVKKEADRLMMNKLEEIEELKNKIANLEEEAKSKDYFRDPDYQFLLGENNRLEQERNELLIDNKKLAQQVDDQINKLREAGLL